MNSQRTVRLVIALLGAVALAALGGIVYLSAVEKEASEALTVALGTAIGAIGGVLSQTNAVPAPPQPPEPIIQPPEV